VSPKLSEDECIVALEVLRRFLGDDVKFFRPDDRFGKELAYLGSGLVDDEYQNLSDWFTEKFGLGEEHWEALETVVVTVSDIIGLHAYLVRQIPGRVDLSGFLEGRISVDDEGR
jgi:hypothetical protein